MPVENESASQLSARIETLVQRVETISDPAVRADMTILVQSLLELHGRAFARVTDLLANSDEPGRGLLANLAADDLVGGLLLLYGRHPDGVEKRVEKTVEKLQRGMRTSGDGVELLSVANGVARIRLTANGRGCATTEIGIAKMIEDRIYTAAPEIIRVEVETQKVSRRRAYGPGSSLRKVG